jgi:hypothetical protein
MILRSPAVVYEKVPPSGAEYNFRISVEECPVCGRICLLNVEPSRNNFDPVVVAMRAEVLMLSVAPGLTVIDPAPSEIDPDPPKITLPS